MLADHLCCRASLWIWWKQDRPKMTFTYFSLITVPHSEIKYRGTLGIVILWLAERASVILINTSRWKCIPSKAKAFGKVCTFKQRFIWRCKRTCSSQSHSKSIQTFFSSIKIKLYDTLKKKKKNIIRSQLKLFISVTSLGNCYLFNTLLHLAYIFRSLYAL